jgi:hypothetical protein
MSKLSKFTGASKEVEIEGEKFVINPVSVKNLTLLLNEGMTKQEQMNASIELIRLSLIKDMPDVTKEEIENLQPSMFMALMEEINEVNGLNKTNESALRKIKEQIVSTGN